MTTGQIYVGGESHATTNDQTVNSADSTANQDGVLPPASSDPTPNNPASLPPIDALTLFTANPAAYSDVQQLQQWVCTLQGMSKIQLERIAYHQKTIDTDGYIKRHLFEQVAILKRIVESLTSANTDLPTRLN